MRELVKRSRILPFLTILLILVSLTPDYVFCYCWEKLDVGLSVFTIQVASNKLKSQNDYKFHVQHITYVSIAVFKKLVKSEKKWGKKIVKVWCILSGLELPETWNIPFSYRQLHKIQLLCCVQEWVYVKTSSFNNL